LDQIYEFGDDRQKAWCVHCAELLSAAAACNRDHVPTKSLLRPPLPSNLPVVRVCAKCNEGFSSDEQYIVAFLSAVVSGSTVPKNQIHAPAAGILTKNPALRAKVDQARSCSLNLFGEADVFWKPEEDRFERVILKNARGHAFFEYNEPMLSTPRHVWFKPIPLLSSAELDAFERVPSFGGWPEIGSRMFTRVMTGQDMDGPWVVVQDDVYRYSVAQVGMLMVRSVIFEYLATEVLWDE